MSFVWLPLALFHIQASTLKPGKPYGYSCDDGEIHPFVSFTVELLPRILSVKGTEKFI